MDWASLIVEPLRVFFDRIMFYLPRLVGAPIILLAGWALATVVRRVITHGLRLLRVDRLAEKARLNEILRRGDIRFGFVDMLGELAYWLLLICAVMITLQFIGVTVAEEWLERFGYFIPHVLLSIAVFLFGTLIASFLGASVRAASLNAGIPRGHLLGQVVYSAVLILTVIIALEQLQVVTRTIEVALYILLGTFGLAFAIAVGLGASEYVKQFLADVLWDRWKPSNRQ